MVLLVVILKDYRRVEEVLLGFLEEGVTGATVVEGRGMGQLLASDLPIFAGVRGMFPGSAVDSQVIISVMSDERARACLQLVQKIAGPLEQPGAGVAFTVPLAGSLGIL
jgi:nitrogen regulatory protein P-II 1